MTRKSDQATRDDFALWLVATAFAAVLRQVLRDKHGDLIDVCEAQGWTTPELAAIQRLGRLGRLPAPTRGQRALLERVQERNDHGCFFATRRPARGMRNAVLRGWVRKPGPVLSVRVGYTAYEITDAGRVALLRATRRAAVTKPSQPSRRLS